MPKILTSPVKRFPGTVTLPDGYTFPEIIAFDKALAVARTDGLSNMEQWHAILAGLLPCVSAWALDGVPANPTPDTFPATPRVSVTRLVSWLYDEVSKAQVDEGDTPNA